MCVAGASAVAVLSVKTAMAGTQLGPAYLFFGCRKRAQDYIYQQELEAYARDGTLTKLFVAFSRDGTTKDYVQHHMAREADLIAPVLKGDGPGYFYVCGDAKHMAKVRSLVCEC